MKNTLQTQLIGILLLLSTVTFGQDQLFSQYDAAPLYLNPSLVGSFHGAHRITTNYRNQSPKFIGSRTGILSYDSKLKLKNSNQIGFGFHSLFDRIGNLKTNEYNLSSSYTHNFGALDGEHHSISFGLSIGLANRQIDADLIDPPFGAPDFVTKRNYANLSTGLLWNYQSSSKFDIQIGLAAFHLNRPNISLFTDSEVNLNSRYVIHGNVELPISKKFSLINTMMFNYQGDLTLATPNNINLFTTGLFGRVYFNETTLTKYIQAGFYLRHLYGPLFDPIKAVNFDAVVNINLGSTSIGISYDRHPNLGSSFEFSAGYIFNNSKKGEEVFD